MSGRSGRPARILVVLALAPAAALSVAWAPGPPAPDDPATSMVVDVAVATVWTSPQSPRPIDAPALTNPVDVRGWLGAMSTADKLDLTDSNRTQTQALYGARVQVLDRRDGWTEVAVPGQPTPKNPLGYPGWIPDAQLTASTGFETLRGERPTAVVDRAATAWLHDDPLRTERSLEVSANTRLPVLGERDGAVLVATPSGGSGWFAADAVTVVPHGGSLPAPTGADLARSANAFLERPYLWGGRSGFGLDCSGFTGTLYAMHGITIPRDASAQATGGRTVPTDRLAPGDLLFYARDGGRGAIHHVAMYVGDGRMAEAFDAATPVRITPARLDGEYWGAVRYLP